MNETPKNILNEVLNFLHQNADEKFTMKNLADHIHKSKSTLYEYFPNKATMITEALEYMIDSNNEIIQKTPDQTLGFMGLMQDYLEKSFELIEKRRMMQHLMYHPEIAMLPTPLKKRIIQKVETTRNKHKDYFLKIINIGINEGTLSAPISKNRGQIIESMMLGTLVDLAEKPFTSEPKELIKEIINAIILLHQKSAS
jgi:AcrR family transcriptional regulator